MWPGDFGVSKYRNDASIPLSCCMRPPTCTAGAPQCSYRITNAFLLLSPCRQRGGGIDHDPRVAPRDRARNGRWTTATSLILLLGEISTSLELGHDLQNRDHLV